MQRSRIVPFSGLPGAQGNRTSRNSIRRKILHSPVRSITAMQPGSPDFLLILAWYRTPMKCHMLIFCVYTTDSRSFRPPAGNASAVTHCPAQAPAGLASGHDGHQVPGYCIPVHVLQPDRRKIAGTTGGTGQSTACAQSRPVESVPPLQVVV